MNSVVGAGHRVPGLCPERGAVDVHGAPVVTRPEHRRPATPGRTVERKHPGRSTVVASPDVSDAMILVTDDGVGRDDLSAPVPQLTSAIDERKQ